MNLEYYDGTNEVPEGSIRISPSQISKFFDYPSIWYKNVILDEDKFEGSTASVLGTVVHACAEEYVAHKEITEENEAEIEAYIVKEADANYDIEPDVIRQHWRPMVDALISGFLQDNIPSNTEDFLFEELAPGIGIGGSCDYYDEHHQVVLDYKTTGSLSAPTSIPWGYKIQALAYAWLYKKAGKPVDKISICYVTRHNVGRISEKTQKPMKDYPASVSVITEILTSKDWKDIEDVIELMKETIDAHQKYPELTHIIYKSMSLKQEPKPTDFPL